ncbi:hypothetical protein QN277_024319 [Acacia crassicarpa]|uniref:Phytocyanin domain-containing protein n=1 Tax=Acacia crassicarpa TaxID=499986 RepID=A0AAE1MNY6_9FABA|nr:hypothetical protein QN277_024319 [Acacia crassicarpa]
MAKIWYYYSAAVAFLFLHCPAAQTVHVVGDTTGWIVPSDPNFYATWASSKTFHLNDRLSSLQSTGRHDVVEVPKESYDSCSADNKIGNTIETGPYNHTLNKTGNHYFICSIGQHCNGGQKLSVNVVSGSSTTPSNAPSPSSSSSPSPSSSSNPQLPPPRFCCSPCRWFFLDHSFLCFGKIGPLDHTHTEHKHHS